MSAHHRQKTPQNLRQKSATTRNLPYLPPQPTSAKPPEADIKTSGKLRRLNTPKRPTSGPSSASHTDRLRRRSKTRHQKLFNRTPDLRNHLRKSIKAQHISRAFRQNRLKNDLREPPEVSRHGLRRASGVSKVVLPEVVSLSYNPHGLRLSGYIAWI